MRRGEIRLVDWSPCGEARRASAARPSWSVAVERVGPVLGELSEDLVLALDGALRLHLQL